jgi:transcription antitermination factor NusB
MQALCQLDVQGDAMLSMLRVFFRDNTDDDLVLQLADQWSRGAWDYVRACDDLIAGAAVRWKLSRLSHVDRGILRLAAYQLKYCPDIPCKVVINEAIEMAKKYSTEQSPRFVNGVLDAILKTLRTSPSETPEAERTDPCEK